MGTRNDVATLDTFRLDFNDYFHALHAFILDFMHLSLQFVGSDFLSLRFRCRELSVFRSESHVRLVSVCWPFSSYRWCPSRAGPFGLQLDCAAADSC